MVRTLKWLVAAVLVLVLLAALAAYGVLRASGRAQVDGELKLSGLTAPVKVLRDGNGVPYLFAANTPDLFRAQGFVTAQHRLMQMELFRATWRGELAASFGEAALTGDIRMRVLGISRNGERHAQNISAETRAFLQPYVDGVNAYVSEHTADHPVELRVAGLAPRPWSVADLVTLVHFVHYTHATNFKTEVVAQKLIDQIGLERARELFPLLNNPDWPDSSVRRQAAQPGPTAEHTAALGLNWDHLLVRPGTLNHQGLGSNNWAVGPSRSASGQAMLANDPHLDNRILPGMWHPVGLFAPGIQAVGAALPGVPGILVGRTQHVAFGVTNAYGDVQDLYIETLDPANPQHYLDGGRSVPFGTVNETIRVKDSAAPGGVREHALTVRSTRRGPVISDHPGLGPKGDKLLVLRSTDAEVLGPVIGLEGFLTAPNATAFDAEVQKIDLMMFNFVFADAQGAIGHRASGAVPVRAGADGSAPRLPPADGSDDWTGFIPKDRMPGQLNPARAWVGTANHDTRPDGFPWYYTNYVAPDYRYQRMSQVLGSATQMRVDDHWALMRDDRNLQSDVLRPLMVAALQNDPAQADLAALLAAWDGVDRAEAAAPLVYQALYREVALGTFVDELGTDTAGDMLSSWYFWQQRFGALVATPNAPWFDDVRTPDRQETLTDVIRSAAPRARATIEAQQGKDVSTWQWGKAHRLAFVSPLRRKGAGQEMVGGFSLDKSGSGETLNRGVYDFMAPFDTKFFASMQLVVDFGDPDKIEAVLAGGVSERHFQPHQNDQARLWAAGQRTAWWFNPVQVEANAVARATFVP
ncbi:penicillin acylase family protein [Hydrogenophaga sp.]|uniref:penicillin acylase family protein n=1 Tax=Hydrogenophaga sp. TaxID=1904254 RepID=UPI003F6D1743